MDPIRGSSAYNVQSSSANPAQAAQAAAGARPSGHASSLTLAMLSHHALDALNAKETQGNEQEKTLAGFAKQAIGSGQLQLSSNQPANGVAQFGMERNQDILVIKAKLNERSEYDVLGIELKSASGQVASTSFSAPVESLPKELIEKILDNIPNGGAKNRVTSLALSSKRLFDLGFEKTHAKAKCSDLLDRLSVIDSLTASGRVGETHEKRYLEFKDVFEKSKKIPGKEGLELIKGLAKALPKLGTQAGNGFRLMKDDIDKLVDQKNKIPANSEDRKERVEGIDQGIIDLVKGLTHWDVSVYVDYKTVEKAYDNMCTALLGIESNNKRSSVADLCKEFTKKYFRDSIGGDRFDRLAELAQKFGSDASSDDVKCSMVFNMLWSLQEMHENNTDGSKHFSVLIDIAESIQDKEQKSKMLRHLDENTGKLM